MLFEPSPVTNGRIHAMWDAMPPHQRPIWSAVLQGCVYAAVLQGDGAFRIPTGRSAIAVVGDDLDESKGPGAFHGPSLDRYLARCGGMAAVPCEALPEAYATIALQTIALRHDVAPRRDADTAHPQHARARASWLPRSAASPSQASAERLA